MRLGHIDIIMGGGELANLVRQFDWSLTELGAVDTWPKELVSIVNVVLSSPNPALIYWGSSLRLIYNDAARPIASIKHPAALGAHANEVWAEAWHIIGSEVEHVLATGESVLHEGVLVPLEENGILENKYWNYAYSPIFMDGRIGGTLLLCNEVSTAVSSARKLSEAEELSSRILQSIGDGVIVTDGETRVTRMNPVAEHLTGWSLDEAHGMPLVEVFQIVNETTRLVVENPADKVKRLGTVVGLANHTILISKDSTENQIDDSGAPIIDDSGNLVGIVLVFREVNERRRVELEREVLARKLDAVLETTSDAVAIIDREWRFAYLNRRAEKILSALKDLIGRNVWEAFPSMIYPESPYVYHYHRAMNEGLAGDFVAEYPDPLNLVIQISARPIPDGIVVFFRDVTEERHRADILIQTEKLAAVGKMASSIAHEINNPLEAVTNLLYIARTADEATDRVSLLDDADKELRRVASIVKQTLRFHRQASTPQEIDCRDLLSSVLDLYESRIHNAAVHVERRDRSCPSILIYEGDVRQVLNNLVGNAIDAMPGGGRLIVRNRKATDWKTGRRGVALTIADTGKGMSAETLRRVFDAFFTTKGINGTGLGLWISAEILERHHGTISIRSSEVPSHHGTAVVIFLPFERAVDQRRTSHAE